MKYNPLFKLGGRGISILILVAASAASISTIFNLMSSQTKVQNIATNSSDNTVELNTVAALGYLEPQGELIRLFPPTLSSEATRIEKLLVNIGDTVKAGQAVALLDTRDRLEAALKKAQTRVIIARANLERVKAGAQQGEIRAQESRVDNLKVELEGQIATQKAKIERLQADFEGQKFAQEAAIERLQAELDNAQIECNRYENLYKEDAVTTSERDSKCLLQTTAKKRVLEAQANLNRIIASSQKEISEAQANLQRTVNTNLERQTEENSTLNKIAEVRSVDVAVAQAELQDAQAGVEQAKADLDTAYVRSPAAGRVLKIHTRPGEIVGEKGIVNIGQTDQMYVRAEIYETDITKVRLGQRAMIISQGFPDKLAGKVDEIGLEIGKKDVLGTDPVADIDARVVEAKIRLDPKDSQRVQGLTNLQVKVVIDTSSTQMSQKRE